MAKRKNTEQPRNTSEETPFAASDDQFITDVFAKVLFPPPPPPDYWLTHTFEDNDAISMIAAMWEDHERSQQPQVDAAIEYLDPSAST